MVLREVMALDVEFDIGKKYSYSAEFLCVHSPAANSNCISVSGEVKVVSGRKHVAIMLVEPVKNYGISEFLQRDPTAPAAAYTLDIKTDYNVYCELDVTMNPVSMKQDCAHRNSWITGDHVDNPLLSADGHCSQEAQPCTTP
ncbi:unnamed protein product [Sphagnum troendelagicum]